eukprot:5660819-Pyramimonas_sp.AAC.1
MKTRIVPPLVPFLRLSFGPFGLSWARLGQSWEPSWVVLGYSWGTLVPSWGGPGCFLGSFEASGAHRRPQHH